MGMQIEMQQLQANVQKTLAEAKEEEEEIEFDLFD